MRDEQITIGMEVTVQEDGPAPINGATGTVIRVDEFDNAPLYVVEVYGQEIRFRAYELGEADVS